MGEACGVWSRRENYFHFHFSFQTRLSNFSGCWGGEREKRTLFFLPRRLNLPPTKGQNPEENLKTTTATQKVWGCRAGNRGGRKATRSGEDPKPASETLDPYGFLSPSKIPVIGFWGAEMSLILHAALVIHLLLLRNAFSCESYEYSIGGQCCPKCDPGSRVSRHCTRVTNTVCVPCDLGWFTEHPNGLTWCLRCRECSPGNHLRVKERCSYSKNTKCTCQPGFFCSHYLEADSCYVCKRHSIVLPGYRVTQAGTENHDVQFEGCPPGTFSSKAMSLSCIKWTNCSEKGLIETHKGNPTSDVVCEPPPEGNLRLILPLVLTGLAVVLLALFLYFVLYKKRKWLRKAFGKKQAEELHYMGPEKECMVTPIQETAPNLGQPSYANC